MSQKPWPEKDLFEEAVELNDYQLDPSTPLVLLLGWVDHEGILSSLKASARQYKKKVLDSLPENWDSISAYFDEFRVSCVLIKLTPNVCRLLVQDEYLEARARLFERVAGVPNLIFVFEDILVGEQGDQFREEYKPYPPKDVLEAALAYLRSCGLDFTPYRKNAEVTVAAASFLDDRERNLIFRLYVPKERLWSAEADRFLQLFQDYLSKVDSLAVRLDQKRTDHGVVYEFHGQLASDEPNLASEFRDFSDLMDLCASDVGAAASLLSSKSLDAKQVTAIVEKYAKEARRLQLDVKHEAESKSISIRHRLESELIDLAPSAADWHAINAFVESAVPQFGPKLPAPSHSMSSPTQTSRPPNVTYNIRPQFIQTVNGIVAEEVHGNQHFAPELRQLLELIQTHVPANAKELETAVYEIADDSGKQVDRWKATQKVKAFLIEVGKKTGDVAFSVLQKYIENQLGL